jgi:hypothetical protein
MSNIYEAEAQDDFNRARKAAFFDSLFNLFSPEKKELLSLQEVREVLKPRGETYRGMKEVPIELIVGSEGRYRISTSSFSRATSTSAIAGSASIWRTLRM